MLLITGRVIYSTHQSKCDAKHHIISNLSNIWSYSWISDSRQAWFCASLQETPGTVTRGIVLCLESDVSWSQSQTWGLGAKSEDAISSSIKQLNWFIFSLIVDTIYSYVDVACHLLFFASGLTTSLVLTSFLYHCRHPLWCLAILTVLPPSLPSSLLWSYSALDLNRPVDNFFHKWDSGMREQLTH